MMVKSIENSNRLTLNHGFKGVGNLYSFFYYVLHNNANLIQHLSELSMSSLGKEFLIINSTSLNNLINQF